MPPTQLAPLRLTPEYRNYVWGGKRLKPGEAPVAEAWIVHEKDRVASGPLAGRPLAEVSAEYGAALLGQRVFARTGQRFPLLIKLLDCAAWLSLQVHPNDEQAARLEGAGQFGKTEAWHFIDADTGAEVLCGLRPGATADNLAQAIRAGTLVEWMQRLTIRAGDSLFIPPGMIHALGPGLLVYEVQQTSDITYRVFDWNRPASEGRKLHIEQSLAVANPQATGQIIPLPPAGERQALVACPYFTLERLVSQGRPLALDTRGESFHILTVTSGQAQVEAAGATLSLNALETALVPAACGAYRVTSPSSFSALLSYV